VTLTIQKMSTRCRASRTALGSKDVLEEVARARLPYELGTQLGPSLDRLPAVIRMQRLNVSLQLSALELRQGKLAAAWARALGLSLHQALARPAGDGTTASRRYESVAAYKAAMIRHIVTHGTAKCWGFPELGAHGQAGTSAMALGVLLEDRDLGGAVIAALAEQGWLDSLLISWDELALVRLMEMMGGPHDKRDILTRAEMLEVADAARAAEGLQGRWPLASRRQAVRLWNRMRQRLPIRTVWEALRLLVMLLERPELLTGSVRAGGSDSAWLPSWCESTLAQIRAAHLPRPGDAVSANFQSKLHEALEALRHHVPSASPVDRKVSQPETWISSDHAGVLLMLSVVRRLDWWRLARNPELVRFGGPRALSFLLAGVGMSLLGGWRSGAPIDPAVALFAGMFGDPDLAGMRQFFTAAPVSSVAELSKCTGWPEALDDIAAGLVHEFARRVRGFQQAPRASVVKQFVKIPGRVRVNDVGLLVLLEPTPWTVALRLSSMDAPLERVEWLGDRRVEFALQGL
jgi:hypothetical protein